MSFFLLFFTLSLSSSSFLQFFSSHSSSLKRVLEQDFIVEGFSKGLQGGI